MSFVVDKPATVEVGVTIGSGQWLLACAGIPVGPFAAGRLAVDPDAGGCLLLADAAPAGAREIPGDAVTARVVPLDEKDLEAIRAAALDEVARLADERLSAPVDVGGVLVGMSSESRQKWASLALFVVLSPATLPYPIPFPAQQGTKGALTSDLHVAQTYGALFVAGLQREAAANAVTLALRDAATTGEIVAALRAYQEAQ